MKGRAALAAVVATGGAGAGFLLSAPDPGAREAMERFARSWSAGDERTAAASTDDPDRAARQLIASRRGLDGARLRATLGPVQEHERTASAELTLAWEVPHFGSWRYRTRIRASRRGERWTIRWSPRIVHGALSRGSRLGTVRARPRRGRILDRRGRALVRARKVVHVSLERRRVREPASTAAQVASVLDVDRARLARAIRGAGRARYIPVVTLRHGDYRRVAEALEGIRGLSLLVSQAPLAPTKEFARAALGTVGQATAEQLERSGGRLVEGDEIGQWGLQAAFDRRLAGAPASAVVVRSMSSGAVLETLERRTARRPRALRTTLDLDVQRAAERALAGIGAPAALVALQPSTGDVLAVANRPAASSLNRAFTGLYPPGSTFKVVTTAALLRSGLDVDEIVPCPARAAVDGRAFRNFEGGVHGSVPFSVDFAQSCNTAFVALAPRLEDDALARTARDFGLGRELDLGLAAAEAKVPTGMNAVARAAAMIGQDRIVASPLSMAGVAATVAHGRWRAPRLVASDPRRQGPRLKSAELQVLRRLMRSVVTNGTGAALADLPGEVAGKSGTAEYGTGDPPPTHAWFIAYRRDLAVAVLVEGGRSGGSVAAPVVERFLVEAR